MGRYYNGDIEGKFWFALQPSDAADRFGVTGYQPNYLEYNYYEENLPAIEKEIANIRETLKGKRKIITKFFQDNNGYNDQMLEDAGITKEELREYADLKLGQQILICVKRHGECNFEAEC